jgi:hypothetical protein
MFKIDDCGVQTEGFEFIDTGSGLIFRRLGKSFALPYPPSDCHWRADAGSLILETTDDPNWYVRWDMPGGELHCCAPTGMVRFAVDVLRQFWNTPTWMASKG